MHKPFDKIFTYDIDGNILHLNTPVLLEQKQEDGSRKLIQLLAKHYDHNELYTDREVYRPLDNNFEKAHMHARDSYVHADHRGMIGFQQDMLEGVMSQEFGPSFYRMLFSTFLQGRSFSINTARGHTSENIKNALYNILIQLLSPKGLSIMADNITERYQLRNRESDKKVIWWYLDHNMYYGGSNIELKKQHMITHMTSSALIKTIFQDNYINYLHHFSQDILNHNIDYPIKMGFSDDGYENIRQMLHYFLDKKNQGGFPYDTMKFRLYYTGKHLDVVQKSIEQELMNTLGSVQDIVIEKKQHSLADYYKELQVDGESIFENDKHNYDDRVYESLKIML